jgi:hypothetical protein
MDNFYYTKQELENRFGGSSEENEDRLVGSVNGQDIYTNDEGYYTEQGETNVEQEKALAKLLFDKLLAKSDSYEIRDILNELDEQVNDA